MKKSPNHINHMALVLDRSTSMGGHERDVIKIADSQVQHLARRSKELDQETRMTVYSFGNTIDCIYFDKDVLRMPSIASDYRLSGTTALIDATMKAILDLEKSNTLYGDHAFLIYVLTDGEENASKMFSSASLKAKLAGLPDNWTVAVLVPDADGIFEAKALGFSTNNISVWNTKSAAGVIEVGETIRTSTDQFMEARATGNFRGTSNLFTLDSQSVKQAVQQGALMSLKAHQYRAFNVTEKSLIAPFVEAQTKISYQIGSAYYELVKTEKIQASKQIAVRDKKTHELYTGPAARQLLALPDNAEVRVKPTHNPDYDIFVQSKSVNRHLFPGSEVILL